MILKKGKLNKQIIDQLLQVVGIIICIVLLAGCAEKTLVKENDPLEKERDSLETPALPEPPAETTSPFLTAGSIAPNLMGEFYPEGNKGTLADYKGKVVLVDFWFMDCAPCIQTIPHLNELHHKYGEKGLQIVGVNPYDNNEKNLKRFPKFLSRHPIDYPIFFTSGEAIEPFNIFSFPTYYLIDKKGKIIHKGTGFSKKVAHQLDGLIQPLL